MNVVITNNSKKCIELYSMMEARYTYYSYPGDTVTLINDPFAGLVKHPGPQVIRMKGCCCNPGDSLPEGPCRYVDLTVCFNTWTDPSGEENIRCFIESAEMAN